MEILLLEPAYRNKYPPLGIMKIASFHKSLGDNVTFIKGLDKDIRSKMWDRIYITSLFSFYWNHTIKTIRYYEFSVKDPQNLFIGGPMATIMTDEIEKETGFKPVKGLLNEAGKINIKNEHIIDGLVPDYGILDEISYKYSVKDAYFTYMTRGCIRKCSFCAVHKIEPDYVKYISLRKQIEIINKKYGEKKDLLLLDNNVLASAEFDRIIDEIVDIGFYKGAKFNGKMRYVDFNQGIDLRLLTKKKVKKLSKLALKPLRIAFDNINLKDDYIKKIEWAVEYGLMYLSNYILFNYKDTPEDFYERLKINVELNERLGTKIFSFPMKYIPINNKDRKYVGEHWNPRYIRGVQCILNVTHGVVGSKKDFFIAAFGSNLDEFKKLLLMPDVYIIYRKKHKYNGALDWNKSYASLPHVQRDDFHKIVFSNQFDEDNYSNYDNVNILLNHYRKIK